jgi:hypothetical protein
VVARLQEGASSHPMETCPGSLTCGGERRLGEAVAEQIFRVLENFRNGRIGSAGEQFVNETHSLGGLVGG